MRCLISVLWTLVNCNLCLWEPFLQTSLFLNTFIWKFTNTSSWKTKGKDCNMLSIPNVHCCDGISYPEIPSAVVHKILSAYSPWPAILRRSSAQWWNAPWKVSDTARRSWAQQPPGETRWTIASSCIHEQATAAPVSCLWSKTRQKDKQFINKVTFCCSEELQPHR